MILNCEVLTQKKSKSNKSKHLLGENEINQLKQFSLDYFFGKILFDGEDGIQNYLVFQPMHKYFKTIAVVGNDSYNYCWQSKWLPDERIDYINPI